MVLLTYILKNRISPYRPYQPAGQGGGGAYRWIEKVKEYVIISTYSLQAMQEIVLFTRAGIQKKLMPQLIPFYFLNQLYFSFIALFVVIYILSKYFLPLYTLQQVIRIFIVKLNNKS